MQHAEQSDTRLEGRAVTGRQRGFLLWTAKESLGGHYLYSPYKAPTCLNFPIMKVHIQSVYLFLKVKITRELVYNTISNINYSDYFYQSFSSGVGG